MGAWLTEAAPGLVVVLLLLLQGRDPDAQAPPVMDELWRVVQFAAALSPVIIGAVLYFLGKHFPGRKEVVSGEEVDRRIRDALAAAQKDAVSRLELQTVLNTFGRERDRYVEEVSHATREAAGTAMLNANAALREKIERVEGQVSECRTDMDTAKERALFAASGVAQLETKVSEMDRRLEGSIRALKDVLLAKLETIDSRLKQMDPRSRRDAG